MRNNLKLASVLIVAILLIVSVYIAFFSEPKCACDIDNDTNDKYPDNSDDDEDKNNSNDDNQADKNDWDFSHNVFIEEGTATWCVNCPNIAAILHELYSSGNYRFYYVSLIGDKSSTANKRLTEGYNIVGYPTVFIDGGYKILVGGAVKKSDLEKSIRNAQSRDAPEIRVKVTAEYDNKTNELITIIYAENNETELYQGTLKVYLTEIISRWVNPFKADDGQTKPYHFGFLDYIINKDISIAGKDNTTVTDKRKITDFAVSDLNAEELMIIAAVFSKVSVDADSYPDGEGGDFKAYYADAVHGNEVFPGGNLPPTAGFENPEPGKFHLFGKPLFGTLYKRTILLGKTKIIATAKDDTGIQKVEFYIDGELKFTDEQAPYEYTLGKFKLLRRIIRKHTIEIIAYDSEGKTGSVSLDVITLLL
jgi:thiol-disulfide isomerase/thioredoxin